MPRLTRVTFAAVLAAALALGAPAAATAETGSIYPPAGSCTATPTTTTPGGTLSFSCAADTFAADETVTVTVTGQNGSAARVGMLRLAIGTASGTARSAANGALPAVSITLPSDANGTYNIAAVSPTSAGGTAAVTVSSPAGGLSVTGLDGASLTWLWVGGGVLLVAGAGLAVVAVVRRRRP